MYICRHGIYMRDLDIYFHVFVYFMISLVICFNCYMSLLDFYAIIVTCCLSVTCFNLLIPHMISVYLLLVYTCLSRIFKLSYALPAFIFLILFDALYSVAFLM